MSQEHRQFRRIALQGVVTLSCDSERFHTRLLDLSLKGALSGRPVRCKASVDDYCTLVIRLEGATDVVTMECRVAHVEADRIGFHCLHIDIDSVSFLKRLIELNLGDPALLERELAALG